RELLALYERLLGGGQGALATRPARRLYTRYDPLMPERYTERRAANVIHEIMRRPEHHDEEYAAKDKRLKIAAMFGLVIVVFSVILGDQLNSPETVGIGVALGLLVFGAALFKASGQYKQAYRKFVTSNMADDGTFGFCPSCQAKQPIEDGDAAPKTCRSCNAKLWRFAPPAESAQKAIGKEPDA
ncbi:MAG: hypothetical protein AAGE65_11345, partial [Planctomycetota bacterium]